MAHHHIVIRRTGPDQNLLVPEEPNPRFVKPTDTIHWTSAEGPVTVTFDKLSPFDTATVGPADTPIRPKKPGKFTYSCKIQTATGPVEYKGGGELEVGI